MFRPPVCKCIRIGSVEHHAAVVDIEIINAYLPKLKILVKCDAFLIRSDLWAGDV
jgi:hypothetical protein